jgi:hypothetical protein
MRIAAAILLLACAAWPVEAVAYENFIPLGHNYSPDDSTLPQFNSDQDKINAQVDIYEAEIYTRQRAAKLFQSRLDQFHYNQEIPGASTFIDY